MATGREIFYVSLDGTLTAVPITLPKDEVTAGVPVPLFTEHTLRTNNNISYYGGAAGYDVTLDGAPFLVNRLTQEPTRGADPTRVELGAAVAMRTLKQGDAAMSRPSCG